MRVARTLREEHQFRGYIHLKTIPEADDVADCRSRPLCRPPQHQHRAAERTEPRASSRPKRTSGRSGGRWAACGCKLRGGERAARHGKAAALCARRPKHADDRRRGRCDRCRRSSTRSANLYGSYKLKRVYYSAFSPIPDASRVLPLKAAAADARAPALSGGLADALLRLRRRARSSTREQSMLDLDIDPKLAWALRHRDRFPLDVNRASTRRVAARAGFRPQGRRSHHRCARGTHHLRLADLSRLHVPRSKALPFIVLADHRPRGLDDER